MGLTDQLDRMIQWEDGTLSEEDTIALFQELIDSGLVWRLQGTYGRVAQSLIHNGLCHYRNPKEDVQC
jgi:hypothetical protein